jgi:hypothetical protein
MQNHVAFVHTSPVHVGTFEGLINAIHPGSKIEHFVEEDLLVDAQRMGADHPALVARVQEAMARAASTGASIVVCTCSTIGGAAERTPTNGLFVPVRIDRAMADEAVRCGPKILLVAALESTLGPTKKLLEESAFALGAEIEVEHLVTEGAWDHFLRGDRTAYIAAVSAAIRAVAPFTAHVIVLAQASMAPAAQRLNDLEIQILSSPILGVQSVVAQLNK